MRPVGVSLIALLHWLRGAVYAIAGLAVLGLTHLGTRFMSAATSDTLLGRMATGLGKTVGISLLIMALIWIVLGLGLWTTKNWARVLTILLMGLLLILHLLGLARFPTPWHILRVLIDAAIVIYLLLPDVKRVFVPAV